MSIEQYKAAGRRLIEGYFNAGDEAVLDELVRDDVVGHGVSGVLRGLTEAKSFYAGLRAAFPDLAITVEDIFGEGDRVALRVAESGTMQGSFLGMDPTGKHLMILAMQILRFTDGKLAE